MKYKTPKGYNPYKGFYDLREYNIPKRIFIKLWDIQDMLFHMTERREYYIEFLPTQWEKAKRLSADYQQTLFQFKKHTLNLEDI